MVRRFGSKGYQGNDARAQQMWQILVAAASNRQILTYKVMAGLIGYAGPGVLGDPLAHIAYWCKKNHTPPLTSIVVNEKTGHPGKGIPVKKASTFREQVYAYQWFKLVPPTREELREAHDAYV
ncbi:MAG: hypothetical protein Q8L74_09590 [Nitrospirota bacterium]|nr:hypothetical protein [Nitrospirota bacterium]MDP2382510.1 hypothetical protein [Nitrospirota bacterium]MDP3598951.1 hypothetical protein [Nitrospirota bacterium]